MELAEHATKVMNTLDEGIKQLDNVDSFFQYLTNVGASHRKVPGFKPEYFWVNTKYRAKVDIRIFHLGIIIKLKLYRYLHAHLIHLFVLGKPLPRGEKYRREREIEIIIVFEKYHEFFLLKFKIKCCFYGYNYK